MNRTFRAKEVRSASDPKQTLTPSTIQSEADCRQKRELGRHNLTFRERYVLE
jgi:hypothetical protein